MVIHVSKPAKKPPTSYGYIRYPLTPDIKTIFLKETPANYHDIYDSGKKIACQQVSKALRELLSDQGFTFVPANKTHLQGKKRVFGVKYGVVKHKDKKGNVIELELVVPGMSTSDTEQKINLVFREVASLTGIKGNIDGSKKWEKC